MFSQVPDKRLQRCLIEALAHPVERRTEVVYKFLTGILLPYFSGETCSLFDVRISSLKPEEVSIWRKFDGSLGRSWYSGTIMIVAFSSPGSIPREEHRALGQPICDDPSLCQRQVTILPYLLVVVRELTLRPFAMKVLCDSYPRLEFR